MARPLSRPRWATSATGADITEPAEVKKDAGWQKIAGVPEKPPYQYFNWFMRYAGDYITWLASFIKEDASVGSVTVPSGETLHHDNLSIASGHTYTVAGSAVGHNVDVVSGGILDVAGAWDETAPYSEPSGVSGTNPLTLTGTKPVDVTTPTAGAVGSSLEAARADHNHDVDLSAHNAAIKSTALTAPALDSSASEALVIGGTNATKVTIGRPGITVEIQGAVESVQTTNTEIKDKLITLNDGGGAASGSAVGIEVEENATPTGYVKTSADRQTWESKAPAINGIRATRAPSEGTEEGVVTTDAAASSVTIASGTTLRHDNLSVGAAQKYTVAGSIVAHNINDGSGAGDYGFDVAGSIDETAPYIAPPAVDGCNPLTLSSAEPGAVSSSTSGAVGSAATAARQDHSHDLNLSAYDGAISASGSITASGASSDITAGRKVTATTDLVGNYLDIGAGGGQIDGFTGLGEASTPIKMKIVTGTWAGAALFCDVAHGITSGMSKIKMVHGWVIFGGGLYEVPGYCSGDSGKSVQVIINNTLVTLRAFNLSNTQVRWDTSDCTVSLVIWYTI
jgi:hypothetical protein